MSNKYDFGEWPDEIPEHIRLRNGDSRKGKTIADEVRLYVMRRDQYRCTRCNSPARKSRSKGGRLILTIDHIIPRRDRGISHPNNLRVLCWKCHNERNMGLWDD